MSRRTCASFDGAFERPLFAATAAMGDTSVFKKTQFFGKRLNSVNDKIQRMERRGSGGDAAPANPAQASEVTNPQKQESPRPCRGAHTAAATAGQPISYAAACRAGSQDRSQSSPGVPASSPSDPAEEPATPPGAAQSPGAASAPPLSATDPPSLKPSPLEPSEGRGGATPTPPLP